MTAHRIHTNPHPMRSYMPLLPMEAEFARFLELRKKRAEPAREGGK